MCPNHKPEVIVYFYKPFGKRGGDVDEVLRLIKDLQKNYSVSVRIYAPIFWQKFSRKQLGYDNVRVQENFISWPKIIKNIPKVILNGLPLEFAFFLQGPTLLEEDYKHVICRGTRVFMNINEQIRNSAILIPADSLGITWYRKSLLLNRLWSWIWKLYAYSHLKTEMKFIQLAKNSYFFDKVETRFFRSRLDTNMSTKVSYARMAWNDISHLYEACAKVENDVAVFGMHAAKHNQNRLQRLLKFADLHPELNFKIIGDIDNVDERLMKELQLRVNVEIIGFIPDYADVISKISSCRYSYHCYDFVSGMQNTVLLAINLGQEIICSSNIKRAINNYFKLESTRFSLQGEKSFSATGVRDIEPQSFNTSYMMEFKLIDA
jgi:glycosyltransferase involved in cell wall biosynthesis